MLSVRRAAPAAARVGPTAAKFWQNIRFLAATDREKLGGRPVPQSWDRRASHPSVAATQVNSEVIMSTNRSSSIVLWTKRLSARARGVFCKRLLKTNQRNENSIRPCVIQQVRRSEFELSQRVRSVILCRALGRPHKNLICRTFSRGGNCCQAILPFFLNNIFLNYPIKHGVKKINEFVLKEFFFKICISIHSKNMCLENWFLPKLG